MTTGNQKQILFTPGPVMMDEQVKKAGGQQTPYFRNKWFSDLFKNCEQKLCKLVNAPLGSRIAFIGGSGTLAMEASILNFVLPNEKIAIIDGGKFGHRFVEIAELHRVPYYRLQIDRDSFENQKELSKIPHDVNALFLNAHETSIGHKYNMQTVGEYCKKHQLLLIADGISLFGTDAIDIQTENIDVLILSSNKGLGLSPGLACLVISPQAQKHINPHPQSYYLNVNSMLKNGERGQTPFTPPISIFMQLNEKLSYLTPEKLKKDQQHAHELASQFRRKTADLPLRPYCQSMPNGFTSLEITDPTIDTDQILPTLEKKYNIILTPIKHLPSGKKLLCVCHMGNISFEDNERLIKALHDILGATK